MVALNKRPGLGSLGIGRTDNRVPMKIGYGDKTYTRNKWVLKEKQNMEIDGEKRTVRKAGVGVGEGGGGSSR